MFTDLISSTPLTSAIADQVFGRVGGAVIFTDRSFISTLRALVFPRMPEGDNLALDFFSIRTGVDPLAPSVPECDLIDRLFERRFKDPGTLTIVDIPNTNYCDGWMTWIGDNFVKYHPGYTRVDKVTDFYARVFPVQCYINPSIKSSVVFAAGITVPRMHYLQCGIFAYLPWYFNPADGASDDEMALIESLRKRTCDDYLHLIGVFASRYNLRELGIRTLLKGFESKYERFEIEKIVGDIRNAIDRIDELNTAIAKCLAQKREMEIRLSGLQNRAWQAEEQSEIMDFFLSNENLQLDDVGDDNMQFTVRAQLRHWNEDIADSMLRNPNSVFFMPNGRRCDNIIPHDDMKRLLNAVFIDQTVRINFCARYNFTLCGDVRGLSHTSYNGCEGYAPNPHIHFFACMGDYTRYVNQFLRNNDYIGALTQCIASCQSLNLGDGAVMREFAKMIYGLDGQVSPRCFVMPDGQILTAKEAAAALSADE